MARKKPFHSRSLTNRDRRSIQVDGGKSLTVRTVTSFARHKRRVICHKKEHQIEWFNKCPRAWFSSRGSKFWNFKRLVALGTHYRSQIEVPYESQQKKGFETLTATQILRNICHKKFSGKNFGQKESSN